MIKIMIIFLKENYKFLFIIILLSIIIYANTLHNDFVSDDIATIVNYPHISRPFTVINIAFLSNSLNYLAGGLEPFGYHLVNIFLHAINSVLVFYFLRLFFRAGPSFWGALIFVSHPVNSEAVAWVSGRLYLLFTICLLSSFLLYAKATQRLLRPATFGGEARNDNKRWQPPFLLAISLILYSCALTASFFPLVFPFLLAAYDFTFGRWRRAWKFWLPFFIIAAAKLVLMFSLVQDRIVEIARDSGSQGLSNPFYNIVYSNFSHLRLLAWPQKLTIYHEPSVISFWALNAEIFFFALAILTLPFLFKKAKPLFFAACLYILFLAPTYSPKMIAWLVAERYLYFPSIAFCIAAAFFIDTFGGFANRGAVLSVNNGHTSQGTGIRKKHGGLCECVDKFISESKIRKVFYIFLVTLIAAYSARTVIRNRDWRTHASIWRATVEVSPDSPKARNNMGDVYSLEGDLPAAAREFQQAIRLKPDYAEAYHNLAFTYYTMGRSNEAVLSYQQAVKLKPQLYQSHANLAAIYLGGGKRDLAKYHLLEAQKFNPKGENIKKLLEQFK